MDYELKSNARGGRYLAGNLLLWILTPVRAANGGQMGRNRRKQPHVCEITAVTGLAEKENAYKPNNGCGGR